MGNYTVQGGHSLNLGNDTSNDNITVLGPSGTVRAGSGNDSVNALGNAKVTLGSGTDTVNVHGVGQVSVGSGNDSRPPI